MIAGEQFGMLTVVAVMRGGIDGLWRRRGTGALAVCQCSCGNGVIARAVDLTAGHTRSCSRKHPCPKCGKAIRPQGFAGHVRWSHPQIKRLT